MLKRYAILVTAEIPRYIEAKDRSEAGKIAAHRVAMVLDAAFLCPQLIKVEPLKGASK